MAKIFVRDGYQLGTISVRGDTIGKAMTEDFDCVTLETIIAALGTGVVADMATARALWTESGATTAFQRGKRELVNLSGPLVVSTTPGTGEDTGTTANIHRLSDVYLLPEGLSDGTTTLPDAIGDVADARNRTAIKAFEVKHDNILKHATASQAWDAYIAYVTNPNDSNARRGYLINPTLDENGQTYTG